MNTYEFKSSRFFFNVLPIGSFNRGLHSFNSRVLSASSGVFGCCWFLDCYQTFPAGWFCFSLVTCCLYIVNTAALFVGFCCRGLLPFFLPSSFNCRLGCCLLLLRCSVKLVTEAMSMEDLWPRQSVHGWVLFLGIKSDYKQQKWKKLPRQVPRFACY